MQDKSIFSSIFTKDIPFQFFDKRFDIFNRFCPFFLRFYYFLQIFLYLLHFHFLKKTIYIIFMCQSRCTRLINILDFINEGESSFESILFKLFLCESNLLLTNATYSRLSRTVLKTDTNAIFIQVNLTKDCQSEVLYFLERGLFCQILHIFFISIVQNSGPLIRLKKAVKKFCFCNERFWTYDWWEVKVLCTLL